MSDEQEVSSIRHQWEPHREERAVYVCKTCGAMKRTSFSRFKRRVVETPCRGSNPEPLPVAPAGPRNIVMTPEVLLDMLVIVLFWRSIESGSSTDGRSFTTVDHLRRILERLGMMTIKQGNALCKDQRVQRLFRRNTEFAYSGAPAGDAVWLTRKLLVAKVASDDCLDADPTKMLRNYRVLITANGKKEAREILSKYSDTLFTREAVAAIEEIFATERKEFEEKRAMGVIVGRYNDKVSSDAQRWNPR